MLRLHLNPGTTYIDRVCVVFMGAKYERTFSSESGLIWLAGPGLPSLERKQNGICSIQLRAITQVIMNTNLTIIYNLKQ